MRSMRSPRNSIEPLGHLAALGAQEVGDGLERRRLARAVGPEERDDAALGHRERHALQHEDHVVVDDLDAVDLEEGLGFVCHGVAFARGKTGRDREAPPAPPPAYFSFEQSRGVIFFSAA